MSISGRVRVSLATFALLTATALPGAAQTLDEIIARNLEARGGVERLKVTTSVKITGTITAQGMELPMTSWAKRPNLLRRDTKFHDQVMVVAFDGKTVWGINPMMGPDPQVMTGPQADMTRGDADFDPLFLDYREKGHRIELVGTEEIEGRRLHHLLVTKKNGQVDHYYLDAATDLEVRLVTTFERDGMKAEVTTELSDYQEVDGFRIPFTMKQLLNGKPMAEIRLEKVEFNVPVDDDLFRMKKGAR